MTVVTGLVDAVSLLALGRVFTANMTGNVVLLAFAVAGVPGVSFARSLTALVAFLAGAAVGGRLLSRAAPEERARAALRAFGLEVVLLAAAAACAVDLRDSSPFVYAIIVLTAVAMGARTAAVRKLAIPDLTTTVLTLTVTGLAADSTLARGTNPRWRWRLASVLAMFGGAAIGAVLVERSALLALVACAVVSSVCYGALMLRARPVSRSEGPWQPP